MEFNKKLQEMRKQRGLTQEELAESLFVSRTAISKWESGRGYPSIESLKAIAKFFSLTVDELLSPEEALNIAEEDGKRKEGNFSDLVYGLLDISVAMLLFLPFFAQRSEGAVNSVSLLALADARAYLKVAYFTIVITIITIGIMTLAMQNCRCSLWIKSKTAISLILCGASVLLFILTSHPYASVYCFVLLIIKGLLLIRK